MPMAWRKNLCKRKSTKSRKGAVKTEQEGGWDPLATLSPGSADGMRANGVNAVRAAWAP